MWPPRGASVECLRLKVGPKSDRLRTLGRGCAQACGVVTCQIGSLTRGASTFLAIAVNAPTTPGTYTEVASVTESNVDTRPSNNSVEVTVQAR
jgi:hypothetical protein